MKLFFLQQHVQNVAKCWQQGSVQNTVRCSLSVSALLVLTVGRRRSINCAFLSVSNAIILMKPSKKGTIRFEPLPGAWRHRVSAGTGRPGVSIL